MMSKDPNPILRSHFPIVREFGKKAFREVYEEPNGELSEWLLFGADGPPPVVVFALTSDKKVIALEHFRYGARATILELPGGGVDKNETPSDAACRELREETGYKASSAEKLSDKPIWFDPASFRVRYQPMFINDCAPPTEDVGSSAAQPGEHVRVTTYELQQWFRLILNGEIVDSKSIAVSMLAINKFNASDRAVILSL